MQRHDHDHGLNRFPRASIWRLIPAHLGIALGAALFGLFLLDRYKQGAMNFMDNEYVKWMTAALGVLAIVNGADLILCKNRAARRAAQIRQLKKRRGETAEKPRGNL